MEFYLDVSWLCFLCKRSSSKSISRDLSLQNKQNEIVQEKNSQLEWIRCHSCFRSFHLLCLAHRHGSYFDENVIFAKKPFICITCAIAQNPGKSLSFTYFMFGRLVMCDSFCGIYPH